MGEVHRSALPLHLKKTLNCSDIWTSKLIFYFCIFDNEGLVFPLYRILVDYAQLKGKKKKLKISTPLLSRIRKQVPGALKP
jgi:hypothetical protein